MDSDDERERKRPRTSLTQLMGDAPAPDSVPNSCSEDSDSDDEPILKPLPLHGDGPKTMPTWMSGQSSGRVTAAPTATARPQVGLVKKMPSNVQTTQGYGGKTVYSVSSGSGTAKYYGVQW
jgi:hypothetical protein